MSRVRAVVTALTLLGAASFTKPKGPNVWAWSIDTTWYACAVEICTHRTAPHHFASSRSHRTLPLHSTAPRLTPSTASYRTASYRTASYRTVAYPKATHPQQNAPRRLPHNRHCTAQHRSAPTLQATHVPPPLPPPPPSPSPSPTHRTHPPNDGVGGGGSATEDKEEEWVVRDRLVARQRVVGMLRYLGVPWKEFVRDVEGLEGESGVLGRGVYKGVGEGRSGWGENRGLRCNVDENTRIVW
ncbi:hypothetical protein PMIN01_01436 [Paraphaeosphaeria minitans]|uniref:Uncharacterized protein n=1 Tax=Paraphaeosphaeria minitans TaxID=565426 RepID=A0A9P6GU59_9PLEO|nr:hypothetical protein PMIN01_01436 [Paraphaeosphaeria minitans]